MILGGDWETLHLRASRIGGGWQGDLQAERWDLSHNKKRTKKMSYYESHASELS
jgi:hypothetical protein